MSRRLFFVGSLLLLPWATLACGGDSTTIVQGGCQDGEDCPAGFACEAGICVADVCTGRDCPCLDSGDCALGQRCDVASGQCVTLECLQDGDCGLGQRCVEGACQTDVEADRDRDGVPDAEDSCPELANADQGDLDGDGRGDACDDDDDNDALPDTLDNCPRTRNPLQGDADGDGRGNACDEDTPGIDLRGRLDASARPGADPAQARVTVTGRDEPVGINDEGEFIFEDALAEPGGGLVRVQWPGFINEIIEFQAPDGRTEVALPTLTLTPVTEQAQGAVVVRGAVALEGATDHRDVVVRARTGGALADTTLTDEAGAFVLNLAPVDHTLSLSREGFEALEVTLVYNAQGAFAGRFTVDQVPLEEASLVLGALPAASLSGQVRSGLGPLNDWPNRATVTLISQDFTQRRLAPVVNAEGGRGQFQLVALPPGRYTLGIAAQGHAAVSQEIALEDGDNTLDQIIELEPVSNDLMRGRVSLEGVAPEGNRGGVVVQATVGGNLVGTTLTDASGRFVLPAARVDHRLSFSALGYRSLVDLEVGWNEALDRFEVAGAPLEGFEEVLLERLTGSVTVGVAVSPDWIPPAQRFVTVRLVGGQIERSAELTGAPVTFTDLPAGTYVVYAERPGFTISQQLITLEEDRPEVEVELAVALRDLSAAQLTLAGLTLTDADLAQVERVAGANLAGVRVVGQQPGQGADLCGLDLERSSFVGADLTGADLRGANLTGARLDNATLAEARLGGASLTGASLFGANLSDTTLFVGPGDQCRGRDLSDTPARLEGANLSGANLAGAFFVPPGTEPTPAPCDNPVAGAPGLAGVTWSQTSLRQTLMTGIDLRAAELSSAQMVEARLEGACLRRAELFGTNLQGALLAGADLSDAGMLDAQLPGADLTDAELTDANLSGANLVGATLDRARAEGLVMIGALTNAATMRQANLDRAQLVGVLFSSVDLSGASFQQTDLRNSQLVDARVEGASFRQADMKNCAMVGIDASEVDFTGASLNGAILSGTVLEGADMTDAVLIGADFTLAVYDARTAWPTDFEFRTINALGPQTRIPGLLLPNNFTPPTAALDLSNADLRQIRWRGAGLRDANLSGADLTGASLTGAGLADADLSGADLTDADLTDADLTGAILGGATLTRADLQRAELTDADLADADLTDAHAVDLTGACPAALPPERTCHAQVGAGLLALVGPSADLSRADFTGTSLAAFDFDGVRAAHLEGDCPTDLPSNWRCVVETDGLKTLIGPRADLSGESLPGLRLNGAELTGVDLSGADLNGTVFEFCTLTGADFSDTDFTNGGVFQSFIERARFDRAHFQQGVFSALSAVGATFQGATFTDLSILNGNVSGADFSGTTLERVQIRGDAIIPLNMLETIWTQARLIDTEITHTSLARADFTGASITRGLYNTVNFSGASFQRARLEGFTLTESTLDNANLDNASLDTITFSQGSLLRATFRGAAFNQTAFLEVTMRGASMAGARFNLEAGLTSAIIRSDATDLDLRDAVEIVMIASDSTLDGLDLQGASIKGLQISRGSMLDADVSLISCAQGNFALEPDIVAGLRGVNMRCQPQLRNPPGLSIVALPGGQQDSEFFIFGNRARITEADFTGYPISLPDLTDHRFDGSNFTLTTVVNADLTGSSLREALFNDANINRTSFGNTDLSLASFTGANINQASFNNARLGRVLMNNVTCQEASFIDANMERANLSGTTIQDSTMLRANLNGANLSGAILSNIELVGATLRGANLTSAQFVGVSFQGVDLTGAICPNGFPEINFPRCGFP